MSQGNPQAGSLLFLVLAAVICYGVIDSAFSGSCIQWLIIPFTIIMLVGLSSRLGR